MGIRAVAIVLVVAVLAVAAGGANADEKPNPFVGRILLSDRSFPAKGKNLAAYHKQLKDQCKTSFVEEQQWKIYYTAFLRNPLRGTRYTIKIYDQRDGRRRMLLALKKDAPAKGQTTLASELTLLGSVMGKNKRLLMTIEFDGDVLAEVWFEVLDAPVEVEGEPAS